MSLPLEDENNIISRMDHKGKRNVIDIYAAEDGERPFITFKYHISGREEGYPGAVSNTPTYILMSETTMKLNMEASAENKNTPINLAQNTYWNLAGNAS
ncbi:unnamed protein product [Brassica rapa]|uniref:Uncharacterized protein n=2 Tax=Brassica TaxID=3705 RepID=A0A3P5YVP1_BRACM|nr:unnamed protein product [Brassica napus]CAG7876746.1 unnamed protein product [Brassica rapa]CDY56401.1 BnaCnng30290D [Brassica napus]VDC71847.1 unnamed protein product [Brassica rapa]